MFKKEKKNSGALATRPEPQSRQHPVGRLRDEFESLFERFLGRSLFPFSPAAGVAPFWGLDLEDTGKEFVVHAEVPGFEPEDFDVQLSGNLLTIRAEHKQEAEEKQEKFHFTERSYNQFQRSLMLPAGADVDKVTARYHSGVLEVHLPKTEPTQQKRIEVKK
jgi:HSP20 family protein